MRLWAFQATPVLFDFGRGRAAVVKLLLVSEQKQANTEHSFMERDCTGFGKRNILLCTLCICAVPGKVPWPVTEFHEHGLSAKND